MKKPKQDATTAASKNYPHQQSVAFEDNRAEATLLQLAKQQYAKTAVKPAVFSIADWPATLSAGGSKADSSIASKVNETLVDMGWPGTLMSAHMIPKRLGGKGNNSNVRPWPASFESGKWEDKMEKGFNTEFDKLLIGDSLEYKVVTDNLEDAEAKKVLTDAEYKETSPDFDMHKNRLKKIPKDVEGYIGGTSVGKFDDTWPIK